LGAPVLQSIVGAHNRIQKGKICSFFALLSPRYCRKDSRSCDRRFFVPSVPTKLELQDGLLLSLIEIILIGKFA